MTVRFFLGAVLLTVVTFLSCTSFITIKTGDLSDLRNLAVDTGGTLVTFDPMSFPEAVNGFYLYLPDGWKTSKAKYPFITFYHGSGEIGDSRQDPETLRKVLKAGLPQFINEGKFHTAIPFIILIPQARYDSGNIIYSDMSKKFWKRLLKEYPIDSNRMYLTGLSMGGGTVWRFAGTYGDKSMFAAAVPICGIAPDWTGLTSQLSLIKGISTIPVWAFHGEQDGTVPVGTSKKMISEICSAGGGQHEARLTLFPTLGHPCWDAVYGFDTSVNVNPDYSPFDQTIFDWFLQYKRVKK